VKFQGIQAAGSFDTASPYFCRATKKASRKWLAVHQGRTRGR
jgi:hypothetical protein